MSTRGTYNTVARQETRTKQMAREFILRRADPAIKDMIAMFPDLTEAELNEVWLAVNSAIVKVNWF